MSPTRTATDAPQTADATTRRSSVHRESVIGMDERVIGYAVTVAIDLPTGPVTDAVEALASGSPELAEELHRHYLELDLPRLVADRFVFVPATPRMLEGHFPSGAAAGRLVLDLPTGFEHSPGADQRAHALVSLGATLALYGYLGTPEQDAILAAIGFVGISSQTPPALLQTLVVRAHDAGSMVIASGVRDRATLERCAAAGIDALRGGAVERASDEDREHKVLRPGQLQCLAALHLLHQPEVTMARVAAVIDTDPVLTLRVLHLTNSGAFGLRSRVDTVRQAVVLLGVREVTVLITSLALDARAGAMDALWHILARALSAEALAGDPAAYTAGMLSALIDELGVPAEVVLAAVGVSPVVADAVLELSGDVGVALAAVLAHERRDPAAVEACGFLPVDVSDVYLRCLSEALETARAVNPG